MISSFAASVGLAACNDGSSIGNNTTSNESTTSNHTSSNSTVPTTETHSHNYNQKITTEKYKASEADCEHAAVYHYACTRCGKVGEETYSFGEALGHDYSAKLATSDRLCTEADHHNKATYYYSCSRCGKNGNETFEYGVDGDEIIVTIITSTGYRKTKASVPKNCLVDKMRHVINNKKNELIIIIPKDVKNDDKVKDIQDKIFAKVETARAKVNETADKVIKSIKERAEEVANSTNAPSTKKSNGNNLKVSKVVRNEKGQFVATKSKKKSNHKKNSVKNIVINQ